VRGHLTIVVALVCALSACGGDDRKAATGSEPAASVPAVATDAAAAPTEGAAETAPPVTDGDGSGGSAGESGPGRKISASVRTSTGVVKLKRGAVCAADRCTEFDPGTCDDGKVPPAGAAAGEQAFFLLDPVPTRAEIAVESSAPEPLQPQAETPWSVSQAGILALTLRFGDYAVTYHACMTVYL
jgi:hypothetical protein